ncbi:hypothetical protein [Roseovarius sp. D0-M9]|uniref:hypothetical protein n=1 Tax=Roseovarius sp. D0-M9 TaxID=3127117 RepID=UPI00300F9882
MSHIQPFIVSLIVGLESAARRHSVPGADPANPSSGTDEGVFALRAPAPTLENPMPDTDLTVVAKASRRPTAGNLNA